MQPNLVDAQALKPSINTIPDELLLKILAWVPYPSGELVYSPGDWICDNDKLKLVSSRFNAILSSNAFKMEVLRCQYNDQVQLYDIRCVETNADFGDTIAYSARIDAIVTDLLAADDSDNMRLMLRAAILVLDYLNQLNTSRDSRARMMLVEWATSSVFTAQLRLIMRFALARVQDALADTLSSTVLITERQRLSSLQNIQHRIQSGWAASYRMHKYRAFETSVLLNKERCSLVDTLEDRIDNLLDQAADAHSVIFPYHYKHNPYSPQLVEMGIGTHEFYADPAAWNAKFARYVNGYRWRFLSPRGSVPVANNDAPHKECQNCKIGEEGQSPMCAALHREVRSGWKSFKVVRSMVESDPSPFLLDVSLRTVGEFLRDAKEKIENGDGGIPEYVVKAVDEAELLNEFVRSAAVVNL